MSATKRSDVPPYQDLIYPTLKALAALGGSAQGLEITARVIEDIGATDEQVAITYETAWVGPPVPRTYALRVKDSRC